MKSVFVPAIGLFIVAVIAAAGCSSPDSDQGNSSGEDHSDHSHADDHGASGMEKMKEGLSQLSPEDAKSAQEQHVCPVSDEMLGTMGAPKKVDVNGEQVWICCDACKKSLLESPDKFLAKIKKE